MKYLIMNADDFGLTDGINRGIIKAFQQGIVTSASILPNGRFFVDAVQKAKENPGLDIGIHLCLTEEKPILSRKEIPGLIAKSGYFYKSWPIFLFRVYMNKINLSEIEKELEAQIQKVIDSGIRPSHINSHQYIHMIPKISNIVAKLSLKYNIMHIRLPNDMINSIFFLYGKHLNFLLLLLPAYLLRKKYVFHADYFAGLCASGRLRIPILLKYLTLLRNGLTEMVCHPGEDMVNKDYRHWGYCWGAELEALTNIHVKALIRKKKIILTNYREFNANRFR